MVLRGLSAVLRGLPAIGRRLRPHVAHFLENELDPGRAKVHFGRSDWARALEDDVQAIKLNPQSREAHYDSGAARLKMKDFRGALADFVRALEIDPRYADAWGARGTAHAQLGDTDQTRACYEKALECAPADWPYRSAVERALEVLRKK